MIKSNFNTCGNEGPAGKDGATPVIGSNGNWWINGVDTRQPAQGPRGMRGFQGEKGEQGIQGEKGETGEGIGDVIIELDNIKSQLSEITSYEIYNESDIANSIQNSLITKKCNLILKNNIIITKPIDLNRIDFTLNANGFNIKLSDNYIADYIFSIGKTEYDDFYTKYKKWFFNVDIDINDKAVYVFKHTFSWNLKINEIRVKNTRVGLVKYDIAEGQVTRGADCELTGLTIIGSDNVRLNEIGLDWWIGDSFLDRITTVYFNYGVKNRVGGIKVGKIHPWGLPNSNNYPLNKVMKIGLINEGYYNEYESLIIDSFDRHDLTKDASFINGGIGIYDTYSQEVSYNNVDFMSHDNIVDRTLIPIYFNRYNNISDDYYGRGIKLNNVFNRHNGKIQKGIHYDGRNNLAITNSNIGYIYSDMKNINHRDISTDFLDFDENSKYKFTHDKSNTMKTVVDSKNSRVFNSVKLENTSFITIQRNIKGLYTLEQLKELKIALMNEKKDDLQIDRTGLVLALLYTYDTSDHFDLVVWVRSMESFYYVKDGMTKVSL